MINWRTDIENAHKDGTEILVYCPNNSEYLHGTFEVYKVFWGDPESKGWEPDAWCIAWSDGNEFSIYETVGYFTHWAEINLPE